MIDLLTLPLTTAAINLGAALGLGAVIGSERQLRQRMAGLRTNALVALGAASFVIFAATFDDVSPTRVAAQIVSGIGFLGAGIIFRDGFTISGLNTAATLWCSAAVGMLAGHGALDLAALVTAMVVFVNFGLRPVVKLLKRIAKSGQEQAFQVTATCRPENEAAVRATIVQSFAVAGMHLTSLGANEVDASGRIAVGATLAGGSGGQAAVEAVVARLAVDPAILSARWSTTEGD